MVACVEVQPTSSDGSYQLDREIVSRIALKRVERCLRPDDLVCAIGPGRVLVCFGHGANRAVGGAIGARIASAVGRPLSVDEHRQDVDVAVGIGTGGVAGVSEIVGAAMNASSALSQRLRASDQGGSSRAGVVVAHLPLRGGHKRLQRREVLPGGVAHANGSRRHLAATSPAEIPDHVWDSELSVLLVSLDPTTAERVNPAVDGLLGCVRRIGVDPQVEASPDSEDVVESYKRAKPEVVILALHSEAQTANGAGVAGTTWEQWARLTRELVRQGATVMAVAIGASVAAVATCVREGAVGVLDVGDLSQQLEKLSANLSSRRLASENGSKDNGRSSPQVALPSPYHRLTYLTTSEHRVLFHMMQGDSAQEIAEDLIVSLATVRSHIRSILRKLRVRSQLAAVALANGAQPRMLDAD